MKKKYIFILIILLMLFTNVSYAAPNSDILGISKEFIDLGRNERNKYSSSSYNGVNINPRGGNSAINDFAGVLWGIGIFVILISGVILGIRYMLMPSIEEKADMKKSMYPYIIGAIIIMGALSIWKFSVEFLDKL